MKALSLKQPWASMIAEGGKTIETRKWSTRHRGRVAICASKSTTEPNARPPYGAIVAVATISDCRPMKTEDEWDAKCRLYPGAWSWLLEDVGPIRPEPIKGQLGLFEIDFEEEDFEALEEGV